MKPVLVLICIQSSLHTSRQAFNTIVSIHFGEGSRPLCGSPGYVEVSVGSSIFQLNEYPDNDIIYILIWILTIMFVKNKTLISGEMSEWNAFSSIEEISELSIGINFSDKREVEGGWIILDHPVYIIRSILCTYNTRGLYSLRVCWSTHTSVGSCRPKNVRGYKVGWYTRATFLRPAGVT